MKKKIIFDLNMSQKNSQIHSEQKNETAEEKNTEEKTLVSKDNKITMDLNFRKNKISKDKLE
jgi:hypothetical protein